MDENAEDIISVVDGDVLRVTLNRPEVRNAQTPSMWGELATIARTVPPGVRFVVLAGAGVDFSAGLDRSVLADQGPEGMIASLQSDPKGFIARAQEGFRAWTEIPQTVIAVVQGNVIGAGFQLALASDFLIATPEARFALRETSLGLIPDLGGTGALIDAVGYRRTFALCSTGAFLTAEQALSAGIVHSVGSDLTTELDTLLEHLRAVNPGALLDLKTLLRTVASDRDSWDAERSVQIQRLASLFGVDSA